MCVLKVQQGHLLKSLSQGGTVEAVLYRTIIIRNLFQLRNFCRIIQHPGSSKRTSFFNLHVKALHISDISNMHVENEDHPAAILAILKACQNIEILALNIWLVTEASQPSPSAVALQKYIMSPELSSRQTSVFTSFFPGNQIRFSYPIFYNTTHVGLWGEELQHSMNTLQHLPHLTHLSVCVVTDRVVEYSQWVGEIIVLCSASLRVFIVWLTTLSLDPIVQDWEDVVLDFAGVPVAKDIWTLAEERIEERLRRRALEVRGRSVFVERNMIFITFNLSETDPRLEDGGRVV